MLFIMQLYKLVGGRFLSHDQSSTVCLGKQSDRRKCVSPLLILSTSSWTGLLHGFFTVDSVKLEAGTQGVMHYHSCVSPRIIRSPAGHAGNSPTVSSGVACPQVVGIIIGGIYKVCRMLLLSGLGLSIICREIIYLY